MMSGLGNLIGLALILALGVVASGCKKKEPPPASVAPVAARSATPDGPPSKATPEMAVTPQRAQSMTNPALEPPHNPLPPPPGEQVDLNRELRRWILANRRPPKSFEDFASTAQVSIPPAPQGKKYAIDKTMHVILVKQ